MSPAIEPLDIDNRVLAPGLADITTAAIPWTVPHSEDGLGFFHLSEDLVELPNIKQAGSSTVDFDGLLREPLVLWEDLKNGCGGQLWPAGMVLAKYLLRKGENSSLKDKTIVEIGAGGGLVGLALAKGIPGFKEPLYITDQINMMGLMTQNITANSLSRQVEATVYDWGEAPPQDMPTHPDVILAADCVYFEPAFPLLLQTLTDLIGENSICYFAFKKRRHADLQFIKAMKKTFRVTPMSDDPDFEVFSKQKIFLYTIQKKTN